MLIIRRIVGTSMMPALKPNQIAVFKKSHSFKVGQIVCAQTKERQIVKRLGFISAKSVCLQGDSPTSNTYFVPVSNLKAKLFFKF